MERTSDKVARRAGLPIWALILLTIGVLAVVLWFAVAILNPNPVVVELPVLPDPGTVTPAARQQIAQADADARNNPESGPAVGRLAMAYHANALNDHAQKVYRLAMGVDSTNHRWPYYLGVLDSTIGLNDEAAELMLRATYWEPDYPHAWARLGQIYFLRGKTDEAEEAFDKALNLSSGHPHAVLGKARIAGMRNQWSEAARLMENLLKRNPTIGSAHGVLAIAYEKLGRAEEAALHEGMGRDMGFQMDDPLLDELYDLSSTGAVLVTQAQIARYSGNMARAEVLLRRAVEVDPDDKDVFLALGRFLTMPGVADDERRREARSILETGLKNAPDYLALRHQFATVLESLGETEAAEEQWERVVSEEPAHAMSLMSLGQIYFFRKDYERACEFYRRGLEVPPDTPFSLGDRARGYHRFALANWAAGDTTAALTAFEQAVAENPKLGNAYLDYANLLAELGRNDEGVAIYERIVAENPNDSNLRFAFGSYLQRMDRLSEADVHYRAAVAGNPQDPRILTAAGALSLRLENPRMAVSLLQEALKFDRDFVPAHFHLGNALVALNREQEAIMHFQAAIRRQPDFQAARDALDRILER